MAKKTAASTNPPEALCGLPQVSVNIPYEIVHSKLFVQEAKALVQDMEAIGSRILELENRLQIHKLNLTDSQHAFKVECLRDQLNDLRCDLRTDKLLSCSAQLRVFCATALGIEAYDKINA